MGRESQARGPGGGEARVAQSCPDCFRQLLPLDLLPRRLVGTIERLGCSEQARGSINLSAPVGDNRLFAAELKTIVPGREFELRVRTVPPLDAGKLSGHFTLKTSTTNLPELQVGAYLQLLSSPNAPEVLKPSEMPPVLFLPELFPAH